MIHGVCLYVHATNTPPSLDATSGGRFQSLKPLPPWERLLRARLTRCPAPWKSIPRIASSKLLPNKLIATDAAALANLVAGGLPPVGTALWRLRT